jgi:hypothetical protein
MNLNIIIIFSLIVIFLLLILKNISLCSNLEHYVNNKNNNKKDNTPTTNKLDIAYKRIIDDLKNSKACKKGLSNNEIDNYNKMIAPIVTDIVYSKNLKNIRLSNKDLTCVGHILDAISNHNAIKIIRIIDQIILFLNDVKRRLRRF